MESHGPHRLASDTVRTFVACLVAAAIVFTTSSCESGPHSTNHDTPPQNWWDERGPVVPHDTFPTDCSECHVGEDWDTIREDFSFDHALETGVRLDGAHAGAECLRCHNDVAPIEVVASRGCRGCHEDPHRRKLGVQCQDCHTEDMWTVRGDIGLHNRTRFPLVGAHAGTACYRCHDGAEVGNFAYTPIECASCHQSDLEQATDPDHIQQGWVNNCDECHIPTQWSGGDFNHESFPLLGVHAVAECQACHENQQFGGQPTHCAGCHLDEYVATTNPNHVAAGFPQDCALCHNNVSFEGALFDHAQFPLIASHAAVDCASCHESSVFAGTPSNCAGCHLDEYNATTSPNHAASGYATSCEQCHMPTTWDSATFDHQDFPLTGAHLAANCTDCHVDGNYVGTPSQCSACHLQEYNQSTNPDHQAASFSLQCDQCHTPTIWEAAVFDHSLFPLIGQHQAADCSSCHGTGVFPGTPNDCASCHLTDYTQTTAPNHQAAGFPTDCQVCHTPVSWLGASFDHSLFPLSGAHLSANCSDCHQGGVYIGTPSDCASCHITEYNATSSPDHAAAGFSTSCQSCHTTNTWQGANFDHSSWPLTGQHQSVQCSDCHQNGVYIGTPTSCVSCHLGDYNQTTSPNHAAAGFPTACQSCHNTSGWFGATFVHDFPLSGPHNQSCSKCHENPANFSQFTCLSCHDHNQTKMNDVHSDVSGYTYTSPACLNCHPNGNN